MEKIEIDTDDDAAQTVTIDKNHNINKNIQYSMEIASTSCSTAETCPTNYNSYPDVPAKMQCETITISDSEDSCSQGAHVASLDSQSDADIKNDQNIAGIEIKHEIEETVPKTDIVSPWSERTRSSRRQKLISYNEDELSSTSRDDSEASSDFPKGPTKPIYQVDSARIPKNNDKKMFYSNFLYRSMCLLCGCSNKNLANHYARKHPDTEVLIARLSPKMSIRIRNQQTDFIRIDNQIHGFCFFCEELKTMKIDDWKKHMLSHTGELPYWCTDCKLSMIRKINHGKCLKDKVQHIFETNSTNDDLIGFICNTCNYLQVAEQRIIKHLETEHDSLNDSSSELFSRVILVKSPLPV